MSVTFFKPYISEEAAYLLLSGIKSNQKVAQNVFNMPHVQNTEESKSPIAEGLGLLEECIEDIEKILRNNLDDTEQHSKSSASPN